MRSVHPQTYKKHDEQDKMVDVNKDGKDDNKPEQIVHPMQSKPEVSIYQHR